MFQNNFKSDVHVLFSSSSGSKANGISFLLKLIFSDAQRHDFGGMHQSCSEGRESRSRLGLETESTETLGLVSVSLQF